MKGCTYGLYMRGFSSFPRTPCHHQIKRSLCPALIVACLTASSGALAHATLVLGTVATDPTPPQADARFALSLRLLDLTQVPVEDARVLAEFSRPGQEGPISTRFEETETAGVYETTLELPQEGDYTLLLRDQTFRQEEAQATLTFPVGQAPAEPLEFVFPPAATGGVWTWIGFLIGLVLLRGGRGDVTTPEDAANGVEAEPQG